MLSGIMATDDTTVLALSFRLRQICILVVTQLAAIVYSVTTRIGQEALMSLEDTFKTVFKVSVAASKL